MLLTPLFVGVGTVVNVATVLVGGLIGLLVGNRLPERTRVLVTQVLGLVTAVLAMQNAWSVSSTALTDAVGRGVGMIVVVIGLLVGSVCGSALRLQDRVDHAAGWFTDRIGQGGDGRHRFITGLVTSSLLFCIGPLAIVGSLSDGLGRGADQLIVKSILDGFAAMAFASALGVGVLASSVVVLVIQGGLTVVGYFAGDVLPAAHIDALTASGGVVLLALALGLLDVKQIRVAELLPALVVSPLLVQLVVAFR